MFGSPRKPGLGAILLLIAGIALLLSSGDESGNDGDRDRERSRSRHSPAPPPGRMDRDEEEAMGRPKPAGGRAGTPARVTRVVDGDTIEVALGGGTDDVRYIGVDTPESVAPGQPVECFGRRASEFNRELVEGERVLLVFDEERRDHYGRLLAYVYVGPLFVNAELVRRGYARTLTIAPNTGRATLFDRLARRAGSAGRGLWSACGHD